MDEISSLEFLKTYIINQKLRIIDVRAPIEYSEASLPQSFNLPILDDEQRKEIGICYKTQGQAAAIERGHQLVSGEIKAARVASWISRIEETDSIYLNCARGGLRSKISQQWIVDAGFRICRILGGYKELRNNLLQGFADSLNTVSMLAISGMTGSGKTQILQSLMAEGFAGIDLEGLANHRGSAFGKLGPQPAQASFENALILNLLRTSVRHPILVEDESRLIGRCVQPDLFFEKLRSEPIVLLNESIEFRADWIYSSYILRDSRGLQKNREQILGTLEEYRGSLLAIQKKLGGLAFSEIDLLMKNTQSEVLIGGEPDSAKLWIGRLLKDYYDPLYQDSLNRRKPKIAFQGTRSEVVDYLRHNFSIGR